MTVYKYLHPDRIDVLQNRYIRFTQPAALNDPFEFFPDFSHFEAALKDTIAGTFRAVRGVNMQTADNIRLYDSAHERFASLREQMSHAILFLSLSRINDNLLMWSHYCDSHHGFVIGLDSENQFFNVERNKGHDGIRDVKYTDARYRLPRNAWESLGRDEKEDAVDKMLFTKSKDWEYEQELRVSARPASASKTLSTDIPIYLFEFPADCVKEVILGMKMTDDNRKAIRALVQQSYPNARLFQASAHESQFKLEIKPV